MDDGTEINGNGWKPQGGFLLLHKLPAVDLIPFAGKDQAEVMDAGNILRQFGGIFRKIIRGFLDGQVSQDRSVRSVGTKLDHAGAIFAFLGPDSGAEGDRRFLAEIHALYQDEIAGIDAA